MNERELVAETIATVKQDGWVQGWLAHPEGKHCILGAIGKARWGERWDIDCLSADPDVSDNMYVRLASDPVTNSLVGRIYDIVLAKGASQEHSTTEHLRTDEQVTTYYWNDSEATEEEILEVLEKAQAEIG